MAFRELVLPERCLVQVLREADGSELVMKRRPPPSQCLKDVDMGEMVVASARMVYRPIKTSGSRAAIIVTSSEPPNETPSPPSKPVLSFATLVSMIVYYYSATLFIFEGVGVALRHGLVHWQRKLLMSINALGVVMLVAAAILQNRPVIPLTALSNLNAKPIRLENADSHKCRRHRDSFWSAELLATPDRFPRSICPNERSLFGKFARRMSQTQIQQSTSLSRMPFKLISYVPPIPSLNDLPNELFGLPFLARAWGNTSVCPVPEQMRQRGTNEHNIAEACPAGENNQTTRPTLKFSLPKSSLWEPKIPRTRGVLHQALTNVGSVTHSIAADIGLRKTTTGGCPLHEASGPVAQVFAILGIWCVLLIVCFIGCRRIPRGRAVIYRVGFLE